MDFERNVILKNGNLQVTLVNDMKTNSYNTATIQAFTFSKTNNFKFMFFTSN